MSLIWGVGRAFQAQLLKDGIILIGQLQNMESSELMRRYGVMGAQIVLSFPRRRRPQCFAP